MQTEGQPRLGSSPDQTKTIIISTTVTSVLVIVAITVIAVIVYVAVRRFGGSKLVLQVTGDSVDIADGAKLPSVMIHRYNVM